MDNIIEELESFISAEKEIKERADRDLSVWTPDYHEGYIDGLEQALAMIKGYN